MASISAYHHSKLFKYQTVPLGVPISHIIPSEIAMNLIPRAYYSSTFWHGTKLFELHGRDPHNSDARGHGDTLRPLLAVESTEIIGMWVQRTKLGSREGSGTPPLGSDMIWPIHPRVPRVLILRKCEEMIMMNQWEKRGTEQFSRYELAPYQLFMAW